MRALVTGATGAAGSYFCEWLRREKPEVTVMGTTRGSSAWRVEGVDYATVDLAESTPEALFSPVPDYIVNFASWARVRESFDRSGAYLKNNVGLMTNLLEGYRQYAPDARFLHVSTSEVYGAVAKAAWPQGILEHAPFAPISPYAASKAAQEIMALSYFRSYRLPLVVTRSFGYVNARRSDLVATAWAYQLARIEAGKQPLVLRHGNLDSVRTFCSVDELCWAYWAVLTEGAPGEVYNIGSTEPVTLRSLLAQLVCAASEAPPIVLQLDPTLVRPADIPWQVPNVDRARARLDTSHCEVPLDTQLRRLMVEMRVRVAGEPP